MLKRGGNNIKVGDWKDYIGAYFLLIDYTDVDMVGQARENGEPWLLGKVRKVILKMSGSKWLPLPQ